MKIHNVRNCLFSIAGKIFGIRFGALFEVTIMSWLKFYSLYKEKDLNIIQEKQFDVISMADDIYTIGGLADRIRGIVSVYAFCKEHNLSYGIYFTKPFKIEEFLVPNSYDWRVCNVLRDKRQSKAIIIEEHAKIMKNEIESKKRILEYFLLNKNKEIHCYSNIDLKIDSMSFSAMFKTLFRPSSALSVELKQHTQKLGENYISISFRFVQLLGDFEDCINETLTKEEQNSLIERCINAVVQIHKKHLDDKILITSDSTKFCEKVGCLPYVYIAPGEIAHVNFSSVGSSHMKTFVDFMLISRAKKAYMARTVFMFKSGFARIAAKAGDVPFEEYIVR